MGYFGKFKDKYPEISWSDIIQLASVVGIEHASGGKIVIPIRFGRIDTETERECPKEGNLPSANPPFPDGSPDAATHLRRIFYRMGFNDKEIVALSGAHTLLNTFFFLMCVCVCVCFGLLALYFFFVCVCLYVLCFIWEVFFLFRALF